jgi:uncharacterized membrane protein YeaQ/YmgE (transglycosylase-associated protein family)
MNFIIWLVVGGLIGYLASLVMKRPEEMVMNVVVGIAGSMHGGRLISPRLADFRLAGLFVSFLGAVVLLAPVNFFTRGRTRP